MGIPADQLIPYGHDKANGLPREDGFDITPAANAIGVNEAGEITNLF